MANSTWSDEMYVQCFQLAKSGLSDGAIARAIGVAPKTFVTWKKTKPALVQALAEGRKVPGETARTFQSYIYNQLPKKLRKVWKRIRACAKSNQIQKMESLLDGQGIRGRQQLFIHAYLSYNFNSSKACRAVNISQTTLKRWIQTDPDFGELLEEMETHKDNFFEDAFINLVKAGSEKAILAAAKMRLHKKGYGERTTKNVNVSVNGQISHGHVSVDDLNLPLEHRQEMLKKLRERQRLLGPKIEDAEIVS